MAQWQHKYNVKINGIYKKIPSMSSEVMIELSWEVKGNIFPQTQMIKISNLNFETEINELYDNKRERCYFAYGMQDIDIYKLPDNSFAMTHSPFSGLNIQYVFADGEFAKFVSLLNHPNKITI